LVMGEKNTGKSFTPEVSIIDRVWNFLSSIRLALFLILIISAISLFGALSPQSNVFHSWIFILFGTLLMVNIIVCSINRWRNIKYILQGGKVKQSEGFFSTGGNCAEIHNVSSPTREIASAVGTVLSRLGYRIRTENENDVVHIAADKNRFFKLGTYLNHLSLVLFVLAYLLGGYLGFQNNGFIIAEGNTLDVGNNTQLSLKLVSFTVEYYTDGTPKDYRSQVTLFDNGIPVKDALVRVNQPLIYKGIRFYQAFFGPAVKIQVNKGGAKLFDGNIALESVTSQGVALAAGAVELSDGTTIRLATSERMGMTQGQLALGVQQNGKELGRGLAQKGTPLNIGGLDITYKEDSQFSGFQVSRDPANAFIWIASGLFMAGLILVLYFPHRQIWILVQPVKGGKSRVLLRIGSARTDVSPELNNLTAQIERQVLGGSKIIGEVKR
jgi:cytochrome c biogenesis protein